MEIVVLDGFALNPGDLSWSEFEKLGDLKVFDRTGSNHDDIVRAVGDAEIVLTNKTPINSRILEECKSIRYIGVLATGYEVVDTVACRDRGVTVTNVPSYASGSVAQHTFALLLEICNRAGYHSELVRQGEWEKRGEFSFFDGPLIELAGKTLGLIGFGSIGKKVAGIARSFDMEVLVYDPFLRGKNHSDITLFDSLPELFESADIISLHCPLTDENREMINHQTISMMRQGVIIINTSRGGLVNEYDLRNALDNGKVAAAALDVVSQEPAGTSNPLLDSEECIITPHLAWAPFEARKRLMGISLNNIKAYIKGIPSNVVN